MPQDDVTGAPVAIVIGYDLWQRAFAGDRGVIGRTIQMNGRNANIVGVMPPGFAFPPGELDPPEVWSALQLGPPNPQRRGSHFLYLIGRLKPGVSAAQAQQEINRHVQDSPARLGKNHPFSPRVHPIVTYRLQDEVVRAIRPALWTLMGAVGVRPADRVRQRGESSARARRSAAAGNRDSKSAGRGHRPTGRGSSPWRACYCRSAARWPAWRSPLAGIEDNGRGRRRRAFRAPPRSASIPPCWR